MFRVWGSSYIFGFRVEISGVSSKVSGLIFGFQVSGFGFRVSFGFRIRVLERRDLSWGWGQKRRIQGTGSGVQGLALESISGSKLRFRISGFRIRASGIRVVSGLGFRVSPWRGGPPPSSWPVPPASAGSAAPYPASDSRDQFRVCWVDLFARLDQDSPLVL